MPAALRHALAWVLLGLGLAGLGGCATKSPRQSYPHCLSLRPAEQPQAPSAIDAALRRHLAAADLPGATLAWRIGQEPIVEYAFGCADADTATPMRPGMRLRLASLSKTATALLVLQLYADGEIELEATLAELAPNLFAHAVDPRSRAIGLRHLLGHCAGLDHGRGPDPYFRLPRKLRENHPGLAPSARTLARTRLAEPLDGMPGRDCGYANIGYVLLEAGLDEYLGQPYTTRMLALWAQQLTAAGLPAAGPRVARSEPWLAGDDEPRYHDPRRFPAAVDGLHGQVEAAYGAFDLRWGVAAGGWLASASELLALVSGVETGLPPQARRALAQPVGRCTRRPCAGLGRELAGRGEQAFWFQLGDLPGSSTLLAGRGDIRLALLSNGSDEDPRRRLRLAAQLLDLLAQAEPRAAAPKPPSGPRPQTAMTPSGSTTPCC